MRVVPRLGLPMAATVIATGLGVAPPSTAAPGVPGAPFAVAAPGASPKNVRFLKASQWPEVPAWGAWSGDSNPGQLTLLMCGVMHLPKPYAGTHYRVEKKLDVSGREWISAAGNRKAAAALVRSFGDVLRDCAAGYGRYTPHPSSAAVVDRTPAGSRFRLKVFALNTKLGYSDPPRPGYALWAIGRRGHRVVVLRLGASGPHDSAPLKGFVRTARAALDRAVR